jgi:hypothetical protein
VPPWVPIIVWPRRRDGHSCCPSPHASRNISTSERGAQDEPSRQPQAQGLYRDRLGTSRESGSRRGHLWVSAVASVPVAEARKDASPLPTSGLTTAGLAHLHPSSRPHVSPRPRPDAPGMTCGSSAYPSCGDAYRSDRCVVMRPQEGLEYAGNPRTGRREENQAHARQDPTNVISTDVALSWQRRGNCGYTIRHQERMRPRRRGRAMGTRQKWAGILVMLAALLWISAMPGYTDRGGHGYRGHGYKGHGYRGHGHRGWHRSGGARVFIRPSIIVPFGAYWGPHWEPYGYPPVVVAPSPQVYVQPSPLVYWYYCDAAQAYYPYVQRCPGGWRPVSPTPP